MSAPTYRKAEDLPEHIPVFPLPGAMLFPRWQLPLNIFEPRYLNMVDDALASNRLIGMVQSFGGDRIKPDLALVGCVGKITSFAETDDARYLITLTGIARFAIDQELEIRTPYRQVRADFDPFEDDLTIPSDPHDQEALKKRLRAVLMPYAKAHHIETDWDALAQAPLETVTNALAAGCPFTPAEKQAMLEADGLKGRFETLVTLLQLNASEDEAGGPLQ